MAAGGAGGGLDGSAMTAISVVMAVYNGAPELAETIDSILGQTERDFEFVIVDDGSTDGSPAILETYAAADPRIRVIRQQNAGLTRALITGCAAASGCYIARQDCGDLSLATRLAQQKELLDHDDELVFVSCWTEFVGPRLEPLYEMRGAGLAAQPISILDLNEPNGVIDGPTCHPSVMFRREAYERAGGYRAAFYFGQDWDLWYRLAALGKFQIVPEALYQARVTPGSISGRAHQAQETLGELSLAAARARAQGRRDDDFLAEAARIGPSTRKALFRRSRGLYFIGEALRRKGDRRGRDYLRQAIAASPLSIRAWIRYLQSLRLGE
jgi:Glycosyl transferase family 2